MIKEVFDSFKDNIKERITNPFLGTFALVWLVHNWRVVYALFNFDKEWKLQTRIAYFNKYWTEHNFILNLVAVALITVLVLIATYVFLALSRFLSNYFENIVIPWIYKISKGKIVTYDIYQKALDRIEKLEARVEEERNLKNDAITERDRLDGLYSKKLEERNNPEKIKERVKEEEELKILRDALMTEREQLNRLRNEFLKEKQDMEAKLNNAPKNSIKDYSKIIAIAKQTLELASIDKVILTILRGGVFSSSNAAVDFLLKHGFIKLKERTNAGNIIYTLTEAGEEFRGQFFQE